MITSIDLLKEVRAITEENLKLVRGKFSKLSAKQLQWRPNESSWNIQEVFAHLNQYANYYHNVFRKGIEKTRFTTNKENFVSSPLGRSAWKSMKLGRAQNVKRKFKAPKAYNPRMDESLLSEDDVALFETNQVELKEIFELASQVNLRRVKVPISISKIVRLRLGDALLFVVYHNERHVQQALNVMNHPAFPKK
ncbi:MAG: DinB family protein [Bacteroidetes bacterium]|nr:MAG: DinB family protein [Bacteroidota bacterium]